MIALAPKLSIDGTGRLIRIRRPLHVHPESPRPVVTCESLLEPGAFIRVNADKWYGAGNPKPFTSRYLAWYCAPLTVIR